MSDASKTRGSVVRHPPSERVMHWAVVVSFILLAATGFAFVHPGGWPLVQLLGGGTWSRILHPYVGVFMVVFFVPLALRSWKDNIVRDYDRAWAKRMSDIINNRDDNLPEIEKYNFGQKRMFWAMVVMVLLLFFSGLTMWHEMTGCPPWVVRIGATVHAFAAFILMTQIVVHVYAAVFWVKGALRGMTRGTVSSAWAKHHHALWYRRVSGGK